MLSSKEPSIIYMATQHVCPSCGSVVMLLGEVLVKKGDKDFLAIYQSLRCKGKRNELYEVYE
jgi:hypothetical protein